MDSYTGEEKVLKVTIIKGKKHLDTQWFPNRLPFPVVINKAPAYIIGNGPSRKDADLESLGKWTYGCNGLYRDFAPNYLITIDTGITAEVVASGYAKTHNVYSPCKEVCKHPDLHLIPHHIVGHNAGATALRIALMHGHTEAIMIGFDADIDANTIPNIYAGTPNYSAVGGEAYSTKWAAHFNDVYRQYPAANIIKG